MPHTPKPVSARRLAANRENAARSTGPRSPEGKARAAQNSRKHGFTASKFAIVRIEELDAIANLKADLVALYQPVNSQELFAVERISLAQQSLLRVAALESGLFTNCLDQALQRSGTPHILRNDELTDGIAITTDQNRNYWLAAGFHLLTANPDSWALFLRYQAQTERLYRRAVEEFERLRALRDEFPNEPIAEPEPEETKPVPPPDTNPSPPSNPAQPPPQNQPAAPAPPAPAAPLPAASARQPQSTPPAAPRRRHRGAAPRTAPRRSGHCTRPAPRRPRRSLLFCAPASAASSVFPGLSPSPRVAAANPSFSTVIL
jgi:hypothetical protein